jgi:hypothetical protein
VCIQILYRETRRKEKEEKGMDWRIILKWILEKYDGKYGTDSCEQR